MLFGRQTCVAPNSIYQLGYIWWYLANVIQQYAPAVQPVLILLSAVLLLIVIIIIFCYKSVSATPHLLMFYTERIKRALLVFRVSYSYYIVRGKIIFVRFGVIFCVPYCRVASVCSVYLCVASVSTAFILSLLDANMNRKSA